MQAQAQSLFGTILGKFRGHPDLKEAPKPPPKTEAAYRAEIEALCRQLFSKRALVTSGKLQMIGLEKIRRRLGASWKTRHAEICKIADEVIAAHVTAEDIHIRCKEDTYLIIFSRATREEAEYAAGIISHEIAKRFAASTCEDLRGLSIRKHIVETRASDITGRSFNDVLDMMAGTTGDATPAAIQTEPQLPAIPEAEYNFAPIWDVRDSAVKAYICRTKSPLPRAKADFVTLLKVISELHNGHQAGLQNRLVCPVSYDTLCRQDQLSRYEEICKTIPLEERKWLCFRIENLPPSVLKMGGTRITFGLKKYSAAVSAEIKADGKTDFSGLRYSTFNAVELCLENAHGDEQALIDTMHAFMTQAAAAEMPKTTVTCVSSLSLATAAVCMGFDCISGDIIRKAAAAPHGAYPFHHGDLFVKG